MRGISPKKALIGLIERGVPTEQLTAEFIIVVNEVIVENQEMRELLANAPAEPQFVRNTGTQSESPNVLESELLDWATGFVERTLKEQSST